MDHLISSMLTNFCFDVQVSDVMHFMPNPRCDRLSFVWLSEQTQYQHLYLVSVTTESGDGYFGANNQLSQQQQPQQSKECVVRHCQVLEKRQLTCGAWEVNGEKVCG